MTTYTLFTLLFGVILMNVAAQENTQTRVAPGLIECYENPEVFERDNRLPMTINTLIELIRKIEDEPTYRQDITQLTISLLHRFRQDGIVRAQGITANSDLVLPFSPSSFHFIKHRTLFSKLLPGNANNFPNDTLTREEKCALHFMISSSIETQVRGDEATRCNQLAQFRASRVPRAINDGGKPAKSNLVEDVEILSQPKMNNIRNQLKQKVGRMENGYGAEGLDDNPEDIPSESDIDTDVRNDVSLVDIASNAVSQCPIENGVIHTPWGAVAAGPLIAGIAAGLEPQRVQIRDLLPITAKNAEKKARQEVPLRVDNAWAATLAGDLGEVTLLQGPVHHTNLNVGASGGWNSTTIPRWYFLSQRSNLEITDAEIRGGIDGLILANNIKEWRNRANGLKLSQVLDMYYSHRGVFSPEIRSCNRRGLYSSNVPIDQLRTQTEAFSHVLDREMQMDFTLNARAIQTFSTGAADALSAYVPQSLNDLSCAATAVVPNDETIWRTASDIYIYVDVSWTFREINSVLGVLLNGIDVHRFGTRYTILNAMDSRIIVNTTNQLSDMYQTWNQTVHQQHPPGLNLPNVIKSLRTITTNLMESERMNSSIGARSIIALIVVQNGGVSEGDTNFAVEQLQILREVVPDLRLIFFAAGTASRFDRFVRESSRDIYQLRNIAGGTGVDSIQTQTTPVIRRIQLEPRRIINHRCGSNWQTNEWGTTTVNQYVEPRGIAYYRVHPNYFFRKTDGSRFVRIQGQGYSSITVCHSRWVELPRMNQTNQDGINCRQITSESVEIDLSNACDGHSIITTCPPLYITVTGTQNPDGTNARCNDNDCRFPDNARFAVVHENLGCFSSSTTVLSSSIIIFVAFIFAVTKS